MSILQASPNDNVYSVLHSMLKARPADVEWPNYAYALDQISEQEDPAERILNKKRALAHKFLRRNKAGKAYRKDESCVFTPQFVKELENSNATRRSRRNPWLQPAADEAAGNDNAVSEHENVLPFGPQIVAQDKVADFPG
jgi:hypothetical protein